MCLQYWPYLCSLLVPGQQYYFWWVTINNLNFYIKFTKSLPKSSSGAKKNAKSSNWTGNTLITGANLNYPTQEPLRLVLQATARFVHSSTSPKLRSDVQVRDFTNQYGMNENYSFLQACYTCAVNRLSLQSTAHSKTFIETLQGYISHWTSPTNYSVRYHRWRKDRRHWSSSCQA